MNILYILIALLIIGVIVMVHEFGHYLVGRLCGIGVVEFAVGMGPKLVGWTRKGIDYSVRLIPIGGFCRFVGEDEESPAPNAMNSMSVWKRFVTVAAGPVMNFVFAYVVCAVLLANFMNVLLVPKVDEVVADMPAAEAGFEAGDVIVAIDGVEITYDDPGAERMRSIIQHADVTKAMMFTVERDGEQLDIPITPELVETESVNSETGETVITRSYQIGILFSARNYTFAESIKEAGVFMVDATKLMVETLKNLIFKGEGVDEISGPVGIISVVSQQVRHGMYMVLYLVFIISLNLGIMNLLPLPALDGGRLVFLAFEGITRKKIPPEKEGMVHGIGILLLFGLMILVTYKDIMRLIAG